MKIKKSVILKTISLLLVAVVIYFAYGFISEKMMTSEERVAKAQEDQNKEVEKIVNEISKFLVLPEETPVIFEVNDPNALAGQQQFFVGASVGDKLLVYPVAAKAIIWSPSKNKIINMGPVTNDAAPNN